jgi:hydrogenase maturation protein HypF
MHHLLFKHLSEDALVMTSANIPGEPMVLRDTDALELGAEVYLMHDREIINRCDDSVLRTYGEHTYFIRRSRGHIPSSLDIPLKGSAIGLGAQENLCGAVAKDGRCSPPSTSGTVTPWGSSTSWTPRSRTSAIS